MTKPRDRPRTYPAKEERLPALYTEEAALELSRRTFRCATCEWAVVMAMRGKVVKHETSERAYADPAHVLGKALAEYNWHELPAEEPLLCPACGHPAGTHEYAGKWTVSCSRCQLRFGNGSAYPFNTAAEAREAFRRMGGKR